MSEKSIYDVINIDDIKIENRIRTEAGNIQELADDIKENGLLQPPMVTPDYKLLAGYRRYCAVKLLGQNEIEVRILKPRDALHELKIEIAENEVRKDFTFSERVRYGKLLKEQYTEASKEVQTQNLPNVPNAKILTLGRVGQKVAQETSFGSHEQFRKAEYIYDNADDEMIKALDEKRLSINKAFTMIPCGL